MVSRHQQKIVVTTVFLLFLISIISHNAKEDASAFSLPAQEASEEYQRSYTDGDQVQLSRRSQLIQSCLWRSGHAVMKPMSPYFASKFFPASLTLAEEEGIGWCRIGKVGTTAWSALFLLMRNVPVPEIQAAVVNLTAHDLLKQKYPSRPRERMHMVNGEHGLDFFSFIVVRHPFTRLISAYRDKLETLTEWNVRYHMTDGPRMTSKRVHNSSVSDNPTFPEFVDYLIRTPPNLMDKHWAPYTKVCVPCNISYSAIIKLETLRADADWIFDKLNLTQYKEDWESLAAINKAEGSGTGDNRVHGGPGGKGGLSSEKLSSKYFSQIGKKNIRRLYEKYSVDFEMFGYDGQVQSYIDMGY